MYYRRSLLACALMFTGGAWAELVHIADGEGTLPEVNVQSRRHSTHGYVVPTASSATKIEAPLRDIPQTVNVVPQSLLRDQGMRSMQDVLKSVPGVSLSSGDGQRDQVKIRGFTAVADQFIDGMRDDAMYFRDLSNIEQVEVIKGPASVLYGRGSSGGLINRITKKPGIDRSEVSAQWGSWGQRRGEFDLARTSSSDLLNKNMRLAWRVTGALEQAESYREQQFLNRQAFAPAVLLNLSAATNVLVQAEYLSDRRVTDFGVPAFRGQPVDVPASTYYGAANARDADITQSRVASFGVTVHHRFDDVWSIRNAFRTSRYTLQRSNTLVGSVNELAQTALLTRSQIQRQEQGYFNQTELIQKTTLGGMTHQFLYGLELGQQNKDQVRTGQSNVATVNLFHPVLPALSPNLTGSPIVDNRGTLAVVGVYIQDMVSLSDQWKMLAGVRYDQFSQKTDERRMGQSNLQRIDRMWSPRLGFVYQPTLHQAYYVSYSQSFQPSGEIVPLATNNAQLAPEKTTNYELGTKLDFLDGNASLMVSIFRLERTHIKTTDPLTARVIPMGVQRTDGVEMALSGQLPYGWEVWSGYAYLDTNMISSVAVDAGQAVQGKRATLTPKHSANLWLSKSLGEGWRAGAGVNYVSARFANAGNAVTLPAYVTVDAMAQYQAGKWSAQLNIMNILNNAYIVSGHGSHANANLPGAPRSVQLTARYAF
ncbi:MAG: TonB-dependent siderophore receptor [Ottowia sp.]|nr:TonB-dependent siderophore receptor [Ottowia sp.]